MLKARLHVLETALRASIYNTYMPLPADESDEEESDNDDGGIGRSSFSGHALRRTQGRRIPPTGSLPTHSGASQTQAYAPIQHQSGSQPQVQVPLQQSSRDVGNLPQTSTILDSTLQIQPGRLPSNQTAASSLNQTRHTQPPQGIDHVQQDHIQAYEDLFRQEFRRRERAEEANRRTGLHLNVSEQNVARLRQERNTAREAASRYEGELVAAQTQHQQDNLNLSTLHAENQRLNRQVHAFDEEIQRLSRQMNDIQRQQQAETAAHHRIRILLQTTETERNGLRNEVNQLRRDIQPLRQEIEQIQRRDHPLQVEARQLREENIHLNEEIRKLDSSRTRRQERYEREIRDMSIRYRDERAQRRLAVADLLAYQNIETHRSPDPIPRHRRRRRHRRDDGFIVRLCGILC